MRRINGVNVLLLARGTPTRACVPGIFTQTHYVTTRQHWTLSPRPNSLRLEDVHVPVPTGIDQNRSPDGGKQIKMFLPNARVQLARECRKEPSGTKETHGQTQDRTWTCCTVIGYEPLLGGAANPVADKTYLTEAVRAFYFNPGL